MMLSHLAAPLAPASGSLPGAAWPTRYDSPCPASGPGTRPDGPRAPRSPGRSGGTPGGTVMGGAVGW